MAREQTETRPYPYPNTHAQNTPMPNSKETTSTQTLVDEVLAKESLPDWRCESCQQKSANTFRATRFDRLPAFLVLHIVRGVFTPQGQMIRSKRKVRIVCVRVRRPESPVVGLSRPDFAQLARVFSSVASCAANEAPSLSSATSLPRSSNGAQRTSCTVLLRCSSFIHITDAANCLMCDLPPTTLVPVYLLWTSHSQTLAWLPVGVQLSTHLNPGACPYLLLLTSGGAAEPAGAAAPAQGRAHRGRDVRPPRHGHPPRQHHGQVWNRVRRA